jgi:hypothetical protein
VGKKYLIILAVLLFGVTGYLVFRPQEKQIANRVNFVCVSTGKVFDIDRRSVRTLPATNPDTGSRTLVPVVERDGKLYMDKHFRALLRELGEDNHHVDPKTLAVNASH